MLNTIRGLNQSIVRPNSIVKEELCEGERTCASLLSSLHFRLLVVEIQMLIIRVYTKSNF